MKAFQEKKGVYNIKNPKISFKISLDNFLEKTGYDAEFFEEILYEETFKTPFLQFLLHGEVGDLIKEISKEMKNNKIGWFKTAKTKIEGEISDEEDFQKIVMKVLKEDKFWRFLKERKGVEWSDDYVNESVLLLNYNKQYRILDVLIRNPLQKKIFVVLELKYLNSYDSNILFPYREPLNKKEISEKKLQEIADTLDFNNFSIQMPVFNDESKRPFKREDFHSIKDMLENYKRNESENRTPKEQIIEYMKSIKNQNNILKNKKFLDLDKSIILGYVVVGGLDHMVHFQEYSSTEDYIKRFVNSTIFNINIKVKKLLIKNQKILK